MTDETVKSLFMNAPFKVFARCYLKSKGAMLLQSGLPWSRSRNSAAGVPKREVDAAPVAGEHAWPRLQSMAIMPQEHLIDEREDGGVGADAECHRQNRDGREARMVAPRAKRKPEIGEQ